MAAQEVDYEPCLPLCKAEAQRQQRDPQAVLVHPWRLCGKSRRRARYFEIVRQAGITVIRSSTCSLVARADVVPLD